ncbi:hypothetical protein IAR50_003440 [Cryptococcus sp. DSM 104548]
MPYPCASIRWVMATTIPSFGPIAKLALRLAQENEFGLLVVDEKTRLVGCSGERCVAMVKALGKKVVDRMHSRGSSALFITDGQCFMCVQRLPDIVEPKVLHFTLSTLVGNKGPLDLCTPYDDLSPAHPPNRVTCRRGEG